MLFYETYLREKELKENQCPEDSDSSLGCKKRIRKNCEQSEFQPKYSEFDPNVTKMAEDLFKVILPELSKLPEDDYQTFLDSCQEVSSEFCDLYEFRPIHQHVRICKRSAC